MKNIFKTLVFTLVLIISFNASAQNKEVSTSKSSLQWVGHKLTGKHEGNINLESGNLEFDNSKLVGGSFVINMESITCTDMNGEYGDKLVGHLKNDDFFSTDKFKTASFEITEVREIKNNSYEVTGNLIIKGISRPNTFTMNVTPTSAMANIKVDRTKYGIKYKSKSFFDNLGDKFIYDEFDVIVNLKF
ncbi:YceI family protein [Aureivirga sp. CE67]|uniref:YceI family protein n=1 Tax=Aureivirga sp. CE67 TaxID=1788983 RepID=UPI0018CB4F71|nr:YceI family protein [Aureivirga sp. CE67]